MVHQLRALLLHRAPVHGNLFFREAGRVASVHYCDGLDFTLSTRDIIQLNRFAVQAIGANIIAALEGQGSGVQWSNWNIDVNPGDPMTFGLVLGLLFWDTIMYLIIAWFTHVIQHHDTLSRLHRYIESVFPGDFGIPRPFYFFLTKSYWCGEKPVKEEEIPLLSVRCVPYCSDFHLP